MARGLGVACMSHGGGLRVAIPSQADGLGVALGGFSRLVARLAQTRGRSGVRGRCVPMRQKRSNRSLSSWLWQGPSPSRSCPAVRDEKAPKTAHPPHFLFLPGPADHAVSGRCRLQLTRPLTRILSNKINGFVLAPLPSLM